jgi:hypothetical protein
MSRERTSKHPPKTLVALHRAEIFLATYVDGQQYSDSRLVVRVGNNLHYLHPEISRDGRGVDSQLKPPAGWLKDQIFEEMGKLPMADDSIPDDEVAALPKGAVG